MENEAGLIQAVDRSPELKGAGIVFIGEGQCMVIRKSDHNSGLRTYVVIQENETTNPAADSPSSTSAFETKTQSVPPNPSTVGAELLKTGVDCGGVLASAGLAGVSAMAVPVSAGFSSVPLALASTAFVATSLRCGMDVGRLINAWNGDANRVLNNSSWYTMTSTIIEAIDTTDAIRSGLTTIAKYQALRKATQRPLFELLQGAAREDRKRITEEMAKFAGEATSRRSFLRLVKQGKLQKLYSVSELRKEVVKEIIGAAMSGKTIGDSVKPGKPGQSPGVVHELVIHVMQEG